MHHKVSWYHQMEAKGETLDLFIVFFKHREISCSEAAAAGACISVASFTWTRTLECFVA